MKRFLSAVLFFFGVCCSVYASASFSTAGFYEVPNTGRTVFSMNMAWRFYKGDVQGQPFAADFDDSAWKVVSIPHGIEYLPIEASGCANYQGVVWYRKHFTPEAGLEGKQIFIHFEGIMGKCEVYLNGRCVKKHYGGYLPVIIDATELLDWKKENVIAVKADNSDDPMYPVGKPQKMLDFTYAGGIYRDCWLVAHNKVFITDPNYEDEVAGGGIFVSYDKVSEKSAVVNLKAHIRNNTSRSEKLSVDFELKDRDGRSVAGIKDEVNVKKLKAGYALASVTVEHPQLWSPDRPYLYDLYVRVYDAEGRVLDGYRQRVGIRSIEFRLTDGLWINGKPYKGKIMGTNRHQDFAVLGNAMPNSLQWRDAKKLKDAGMDVIRTHYVIDPAFMDACDELGIFALVETPGWQFWNKDPLFAERTYSDIRNMVRIHRNHASLFFWEPILNETNYPEEFARKAVEICEEEYPYPYSTVACDQYAQGSEYFPLFLRPLGKDLRKDKNFFIREWGDNVDNWFAQNSDSRVARGWGEVPMLLQAEHYACPYYLDKYPILCYETICRMPPHVVGACFWHSFDHQRGYHADPFFGGMMDAFRQPKISYYMFMSQRPADKREVLSETGPMVYIANELTPFSPQDITVFSNCEEVHLTVFKEGKKYVHRADSMHEGMPHPIIRFKGLFQYMEWTKIPRPKRDEAYVLAEGLIGGKVVATHLRYPAAQPDHISLRLDNEKIPLRADGSDVVAVIAEMVDKRGMVKRLNNSMVRFKVEGEGRILGEEVPGINPQPLSWGSAVALVQSTEKAGPIKITVSLTIPGENRPLDGVLEFSSVESMYKELYSEKEQAQAMRGTDVQLEKTVGKTELERENERLKRELNQLKMREVEKQQTAFGKGIN